MKRILILSLIMCLAITTSASAFELKSIEPDNSFINWHDTAGDNAYIQSIANGYADRFIVEKVQSCNISEIDKYLEKLSEPLTLKELDNGKMDISNEYITNDDFRRKMNLFGSFAGFAGYKAEFEPLAYYNIYRNITLVGGYVKYTKTYDDPDEAYWNCVCRIEQLTKEKVDYNTRMKMVDKIHELNDFIDNDRSFKIFILKDGKVNSIWRRGD